MPNTIIPYRRDLKLRARKLRNGSTFSEVLLWQKIRRKSLGFEFHRQVPIGNYIVDFYCHELMLAIEIDGSSHDNKFLIDKQRQKKLESFGVNFLRFKDIDVKRAMVNVLRGIEQRIAELAACKDIPLTPLLSGKISH